MNMLRDMLQPARRNMLRGMFTSTSALTRFGINGVEAALALDFIASEYRTGNTTTTFADAFTGTSPKLTYSTAAGSNSTMTQGYGPELVTDFSTYASDADFFADGFVRSDVAKATFDPEDDTLDLEDNVNVRIDGHVSFVTGTTYEVSITNDGPGTIFFQDNFTDYNINLAPGTNTFVFTKGSGSNVRVGTGSDPASISNISVREAPKIVWAPHNLVPAGEDPSDWATTAVTLTTSDVSDPNGGTNAATFTLSSANGVQANWDNLGTGYSGLWMKVGVYLKVGGGTRYFSVGHWETSSDNCGSGFDLETGVVTGTGGIGTDQTARNGAIQDLGDGWFYCSVEVNFPTATFYPAVFARTTSYTSGSILESWTPAGTETYSIYGFHAHRSDLGGMHPVPGADTGFETYVPTNGNPEYLPRVGHHVYNGSAWVNEGLLIESEQRTNLVTYSEDFTQSDTVSVSRTYNVATAPSGSITADRITGDGTSNSHYVYVIDTGTGTHTQSVYVKYVDTQWVQLVHTSSVNEYANFDIQNGVLGSKGSSITSSAIEDVGNSWYRISVTHAAASSALWGIALVTAGTATWLASNTLATSVDLWGWQLEAAPTPSSYIPTSGSTVTRGGQSLVVPANWYDVDNPTYTGPELVTNGDFSNGTTGWAGNNATLSLSSGRLRVTDNGASSYAYQVLTVEPGKTYKLTFDYLFPSANTGTDYEVNIRNTSQSGSILKGLNIVTTTWVEDVLSSNSLVFTPNTSTVGLTLASSSATGDYADFDNISVRQVSAPQFGWPEPEFIGPELVVDGSDNWIGDFDSSADVSGWTGRNANTQLSLDSNRLRVETGAADVAYAYKQLTADANKVYRVTLDYENVQGVVRVYVGAGPGNNTYYDTGSLTGSGSLDFVFVPWLPDPYISFYAGTGNTLGDASLYDNISVREINPLSVSIQMDGRMTYADENSPGEVYWLVWDGTSDISMYYATDGAYDRTKFVNGNVIEQNDSGSQTEYLFSPGNLVPFNIAGRFGSTFVNGAVNGVAMSGDTTPTALPDLSNTNLQIAQDFMGTIGQFRQFAGDIGDAGLVTATNPSTEPTLSLTFDGSEGSFYNLSWSE